MTITSPLRTFNFDKFMVSWKTSYSSLPPLKTWFWCISAQPSLKHLIWMYCCSTVINLPFKHEYIRHWDMKMSHGTIDAYIWQTGREVGDVLCLFTVTSRHEDVTRHHRCAYMTRREGWGCFVLVHCHIVIEFSAWGDSLMTLTLLCLLRLCVKFHR